MANVRRHPRATRSYAACLLGVFVALILAPGAYQLRYGTHRSDWQRWGAIVRAMPIEQAPKLIEDDVNQRFLAARAARTLVNRLPVETLKPKLTENVIGSQGYVYYSVDAQVPNAAGFLNRIFDRGNRAADAIIDLKEQLKARGIALVVVPVPAKASIYPEFIDPKYNLALGPNRNVDHDAWITRLRGSGVDVIDMTDAFWVARAWPVYFQQDTHWSQRAARAAAAEVATRLRSRVNFAPWPVPYTVGTITSTRNGDLCGDAIADLIPIHEQRLQLMTPAGPFVGGEDAPVLLLGDSFAALNDDDGTGFAQMLTLELGQAVQSAAQIGGKGDSIREVLQDHPQLLQNKRAVVLVFTIRLLLCCDWHRIQAGR
jgi:hypothetical protein